MRITGVCIVRWCCVQYMGTDFRREVDETYALLSYYAASSGNSLQTFRDNLSVPLNLEDGADRLSLMVHYSLCNDPEERSSHRYRRFAGTSYFLFQNIFFSRCFLFDESSARFVRDTNSNACKLSVIILGRPIC